jgi:hypothetical protein
MPRLDLDICQAPRSASGPDEVANIARNYTITGDEQAVFSVIRQGRDLGPLLVEAVTPLRRSFGDSVPLRLKLLIGGEEEPSLVALAIIPTAFPEPEEALSQFDKGWWLDNCHRAGAMVVFDYEFQDAF